MDLRPEPRLAQRNSYRAATATGRGQQCGECTGIAALTTQYGYASFSFNGSQAELNFSGDTTNSSARLGRPAADFTDMHAKYSAPAPPAEESDGQLKIKRELADNRWMTSLQFYADGDFAFAGGRVGFEIPAGVTVNETTIPAKVDGEANPVLKPYVLGKDAEANALSVLLQYPDVLAAPMSEWMDGRDELLDSHLALNGRNVRVYDVPANTTLISVKGPRWSPQVTTSRCYFALDPPRQFLGDLWAVPMDGSSLLNITHGFSGGITDESDLFLPVTSSSVGFGTPRTFGLEAQTPFLPIRNYSFPASLVTVGEQNGTYEPGPTIQGVRLFYSRLDPTVRYKLTIGAQDSLCVFDRLELVQERAMETSGGSGLSGGAIAGIVVGVVVGVGLLLLLGLCLWRRRKSSSKAEDFEITDVSMHEGKPLAEMGAPTPILPQSEFPDRDRQTDTQLSGDSRLGTTLVPTGNGTGTLEAASTNTMGPSATLPPTVVRHEEDAGSLEAELPEGTSGGEVVLPPVYRDEWVGRRAGRGLGISTNVSGSHPSNELTAEEIKYLGPPTPSATMMMSPSPVTPGPASAHTFGHWMNEPLSPGAQVSPVSSHPLSPLSATPSGKAPLHRLHTESQPPWQPGSQPDSPATATTLSPLGSQPTGSIPETNPLVTPFPADIRPSETTPNGVPEDVKQ